MKVQELFTQDVRCCRPEDNLTAAAQIMWENDCGCAPVVDGELRVVGMITDRDICMAAYTQGRRLTEIDVGSVMSKNVLSCRSTDSVASAGELMRAAQLRRLPVIDDGARLVGVLSLNDIAREFAVERPLAQKEIAADDVALILATVCAHRTRPGYEIAARPVRQAAPESEGKLDAAAARTTKGWTAEPAVIDMGGGRRGSRRSNH
jgi:CBS domain-containing protein